MPTNADTSAAKILSSFHKLSQASDKLNAASDQLGTSINSLDEALSKLNIGVSTWMTFKSTPDEDAQWSSVDEQIGYAKVGNRKGLSLRLVQADNDEEIVHISDTWLFNDAPRELRLRAVEHIPDLIDDLRIETERTAASVAEKLGFANQLTATINAAMIGANAKGGR
jgi:hypothetical protein